MTIKIAVRGYADQQRIFEDLIELDEDELHSLVPKLAEQHATSLAAHELHMVEIEFLDDPNPKSRFFRFGTDPRDMVCPLGIHLRRGAL